MDQNGKDDLKTQFATREGTYRLLTLSEYSRPNRVGYQSNQNNPQVRVSLLPAKLITTDSLKASVMSSCTTTTNAPTTTTITSTNSTISNSVSCFCIFIESIECETHPNRRQQFVLRHIVCRSMALINYVFYFVSADNQYHKISSAPIIIHNIDGSIISIIIGRG